MPIDQPSFARRVSDERAELLVQAIETLAGAAGMDDVVATLRNTARRLIGADGIAVILREGEQCWYVEEDAMGPLWKGHKFPLASCISGWAMLHRETVVIEDIRHDPRIPQELYLDTFVRSMLMVPVRSADPIGAIGAYWSETYRASDDQVEMLERLARATATAMENVRLIAALSKALDDAELARDELKHRVKNAFTAAQALASLTLPQEHHRALNSRIAALARAHDLLDEKLAAQESITLSELIAAELEPYATDSPGRLQLDGEHIELGSAQAVALGLVVNELATNALKYGALSTPSGRLDVAWRRDEDKVVVTWREADGPEVRASAMENFGSRLLRRLVEGQLRGTVRRELGSLGVTCILEFPLAKIAAPAPVGGAGPADSHGTSTVSTASGSSAG
ncbi:HWE histidine kinase domain-containing protein [Sphingomonas sp.]|uniref:sensor histidine kinase n=1 Tax=Sphingomonas sp. TaxID=28214 RepID=UPI00286DBB7C|nr:HWE histidine kinase domain-containing protein [Sphingomonas sp.]